MSEKRFIKVLDGDDGYLKYDNKLNTYILGNKSSGAGWYKTMFTRSEIGSRVFDFFGVDEGKVEVESKQPVLAMFTGSTDRKLSMGFKNGHAYELTTQVKRNLIFVKCVDTGLYCTYSRLETFLENWELV